MKNLIKGDTESLDQCGSKHKNYNEVKQTVLTLYAGTFGAKTTSHTFVDI